MLIGLIGSYIAVFYLFFVGFTMASSKASLENAGGTLAVIAAFLLLGDITVVLILDARGFLSLNGTIKWHRLPLLIRLVVGYFSISIWPYMLFAYYIQAFQTYRRANANALLPNTQPSPDLASPKAFFKSGTFKALIFGIGAFGALIVTATIATQINVEQPLYGRLVAAVGYITAIPASIYGHRTLKSQRQSYGRTPSTRIVLIGLWSGYIVLGMVLLATPSAIFGPF